MLGSAHVTDTEFAAARVANQRQRLLADSAGMAVRFEFQLSVQTKPKLGVPSRRLIWKG